MKPGRNDPCPCGSGRKYKQCCLAQAEAVPPDELAWRRVRRAVDPLFGELLGEAARRFGDEGLAEAWAEFNLWQTDEPFDPDAPIATMFLSWMVYDWQPDPLDTALPEAAHDATATQAYLARAGHRLEPIARRYAEACGTAAFSFYEVVDCTPGQGLRLRDLLLGTETEVTERSGSRYAQPGDLTYAKIVAVEGMHLVEVMSPLALPPQIRPAIIELRRKISAQGDLFGAELLREYDIEAREIFLPALDRLLHPRLPELQNTDGDPLEMHTLVFDLDSPQDAFSALADLGAGFTEPVVERDGEGGLLRAEITWSRAGNKVHEHWSNTSLGLLRIEGSRLTAEVNSARRAAALRRLLKRRLRGTAHERPGVVQSVQSMLGREPTPQEQASRDRHAKEQAEFAARPEVQAALNEHLRQHYRKWVDNEVPALGNRTPREAVRDADGREAVEALIAQIERDGPKMSPPMDPAIVRELREALGLKVG
jgi:hypothetical protein